MFTNVVDTYHPPIVGPIAFDADIEARQGHFSVPGVIEAEGRPILNPVTGNPHRARVTLPHGFEYDTAEYASAKAKSGNAAIAIDYANSHAHFAWVKWTPQASSITDRTVPGIGRSTRVGTLPDRTKLARWRRHDGGDRARVGAQA